MLWESGEYEAGMEYRQNQDMPFSRPSRDDSTTLMPPVLAAIPDLAALIRPDGTLAYISETASRRLGAIHPHGGRPVSWLSLFPVHLRPQVGEALQAAREGRDVDAVFALSDVWNVTLRPAGEAGVVCLDRHATDADYDMRLREIDHRMKNSLATISSLMRIQSRASDHAETRSALEASSLRVLTIGRVHEQLYRSTLAGGEAVDLKAYLGPLVEDIVASLSDGQVHLLCELDRVRVPSSQALGIGLIVTELVMNSLRHAVGSGTDGGLLRVIAGERDGVPHIVVEDNGPGLHEAFVLSGDTGIGGRIVDLYTRGLGAGLTHGSGPGGGARFVLTLSA